jgi:hypothetical protein
MVCGWNFQLFSSRHTELIILGNNNIMSMSFFVFEKKESKGDNQIVDYEIFYIILIMLTTFGLNISTFSC